MRQKRAKAYRKLMALYERSFGFRQPYQVLVDADFCETAVQLKMDLLSRLQDVVQGTCKPMITQCCIASLYALGRTGQPIVDLAKTFERRRCNHLEKPLSPEECLSSVIGPTNKHRYVVATQSMSLRDKLRDIPGVPLVCLNRAVMIMEGVSDKTMDEKEKAEEKTLHVPATEAKTLEPTLKALEEEQKLPPMPRKKKAKGPNPLSVRKPKPKVMVLSKPAKEARATELGKRKRVEVDDDDDEVEIEVDEVDTEKARGTSELQATRPGKRKRRKKAKKTKTSDKHSEDE